MTNPKGTIPLNCFAKLKSNQIYPLIHDLKPLQQKQEVNAPRGNALIDDYINEREERPKYNMLDDINDINDILKIEMPKDCQVRRCFWWQETVA